MEFVSATRYNVFAHQLCHNDTSQYEYIQQPFYQIKPRLRILYHYRLQIHAFIVIVTLMLFATAFKKKGL